MSTLALPQTPPASPAGSGRKRLSPWHAWGMILLAPYVLVFLVFVLFPVCYGLWLARNPASYAKLLDDPVFPKTVLNTLIFLVVAVNLKFVAALVLSGFFVRANTWIKWLSLLFILPWAVPSIPTILSFRFMLNPEWGIVNSVIFRLTGADGPNWLNDQWIALSAAMLVHIWKSLPFWTLILIAGRLAIPGEHYAADALRHLDDPVHDLDAGRFQQRLPAHRRRSCRPHPCARYAGDPLSAARPGRHGDGDDRLCDAAGAPARLVHDETAVEMSPRSSLCAASPHPASRDQPSAVLRPAALCSPPPGGAKASLGAARREAL
jgi:hypothetical protein